MISHDSRVMVPNAGAGSTGCPIFSQAAVGNPSDKTTGPGPEFPRGACAYPVSPSLGSGGVMEEDAKGMAS